MQTHKAQPHYAPSSVGALMDTAFLRGAMIEANQDCRTVKAPLPTLRLRWHGAIHAIAVAFRRP